MRAVLFSLTVIQILLLTSQLKSSEQRELIIAAIEDNGCASYQPPAPEHKTNIQSYNLDSLKGNK